MKYDVDALTIQNLLARMGTKAFYMGVVQASDDASKIKLWEC